MARQFLQPCVSLSRWTAETILPNVNKTPDPESALLSGTSINKEEREKRKETNKKKKTQPCKTRQKITINIRALNIKSIFQ